MAKRRTYNLPEVRRRLSYLQGRLGHQALADSISGGDVSRLNRMLAGDSIPQDVASKINKLYNRIWTKENLIWYDFDSWWLVMEELIRREADTFNAQGADGSIDWMYDNLVGHERILTVKNSTNRLFGWLDMEKISDINNLLEVFYFVIYNRSPFNQINGQSARMGSTSWNMDRMRVTKAKLPTAFRMIEGEISQTLANEIERGLIASWISIAFRVY